MLVFMLILSLMFQVAEAAAAQELTSAAEGATVSSPLSFPSRTHQYDSAHLPIVSDFPKFTLDSLGTPTKDHETETKIAYKTITPSTPDMETITSSK